MRIITKETKIDKKHDVEFLPFVDMDPNYFSTIYTTLSFVIEECRKHDIEAIVTFDQPRWLKSMMIKKKDLPSDAFYKAVLIRQSRRKSTVSDVNDGSDYDDIVNSDY